MGDSAPAARSLTNEPIGVEADGTCPFQVNGLCGIRDIRPMGCRVFFCQQGTEDWQREVYERYLGEVRKLHDEHNVPYRYLEWRAALTSAAATSGV